METLYHPNAMPEHIRERLPNPSRPIDEPVIPAAAKLFDEIFDPIYLELSEALSQKNIVKKSPFPKAASVDIMLNFLKKQQIRAIDNSLTLADFVKNVRPLGQSIIENVVTSYPDFYLKSAENRFMMMAQFWQNLMALFLIAQCNTRKTLNHELTLQTLSEKMNMYLEHHRLELAFLTHHRQLMISPHNVAFAILALGGRISKKGRIAERVTNISSNNFLTDFK